MKKDGAKITRENFVGMLKKFRWTNGVVPAVIQDYTNREVLMVAYMNQESLYKTLATGETYFFSRSRQTLWHKGETSGHVQKVRNIYVDCDFDTLLVEVDQTGVACHTGASSCFSTEEKNILQTLEKTIEERKQTSPTQSYTSMLLSGGIDMILKKVGEETTEFIISAKNADKKAIIHEAADCIYHLFVALSHHDIVFSEIEDELKQRTGQSGLAEKKSRTQNKDDANRETHS